MRHRVLVLGVLVGLLAGASSARAELVYFASGRTMSVKSHRIEGSNVVLLPREGGEITLDASAVARVLPDEVPYPEPESASAQSAADARLDANAAERGTPPSAPAAFDEIINRTSAEQGVDVRLVRAVIAVESAYQPRARSPKGAMGLMQIMPATARQYAVTDPYEPAANLRAGIQHLKSLLERFPVALALAAYNAGETAVQRFGGMPPYPETRSYVQRILQLASR